MPRSSQPTIKRIIAAASSLFYERGIRTVNMDMIIERAGFSRRTIYYHFRSKDELVAAYLLAQEEMILDLYQSWYADAQGPVAEKLRALFKGLGDAASKPGWAGCAFRSNRFRVDGFALSSIRPICSSCREKALKVRPGLRELSRSCLKVL